MNREIKFRAFDDGKMIYPTNALSNLNRFFRLIREDAILMQYTGLKDRNDKEIYEGDILRMKNVGWKYTLVKFNNGVFAFFTTEYEYLTPLVPQYWEEGEVVGNIYETPELLEVGSNAV